MQIRFSPWLGIDRLAPFLFVTLWSTGFIGAKFGLPDCGPLNFLAIRFVCVTALMAPIAWLARVRWPASPRQWGEVALAGLLMQFGYLGGVFVAIDRGLPAGAVAILVGLQPIFTAALSGPLLGETVTRRQWAGLFLGLAGAALVIVNPRVLDLSHLEGYGFALAAMISITLGTLYQKRINAGLDLRVTVAIQNAASCGMMLLMAALFETRPAIFTPRLIFAIAWLSLVLSVGAIMLLYLLINRGSAAKVSSLFYLVPAVTALFAFALFGEALSPQALIGMVLAGVGVALARA